MPSKSLSRSSLLNFQKYSSLLAGNNPYIPPPAGAFHYLEEIDVTDPQANAVFSNLVSTYGSDYQHLQVRLSTRTTRGTTSDAIYIRANNVTSAVYSSHALRSGSAYNAAASQDKILMGESTSYGDDPYNFSAMTVDILDPFETSKSTTFVASNAIVGNNSSTQTHIYLSSGLYQQNTAIDELDFFNLTTWGTGSHLALFGLKAA